MFGEEDALNDRIYTTTVRCISATAIVYCIKTNEFIQKFQEKAETWWAIHQRIDDKDTETILKIRQHMKRSDPEYMANIKQESLHSDSSELSPKSEHSMEQAHEFYSRKQTIEMDTNGNVLPNTGN